MISLFYGFLLPAQLEKILLNKVVIGFFEKRFERINVFSSKK